MSLLELSNVTKRYTVRNCLLRRRSIVEAVSSVTLSLPEGTCLGLVGESGCGKSTLGKLILGLEMPDQGEVSFQGKNIHTVRPVEQKGLRRDMQVVFQDCYSSVNPRFTAGMIISEPMRNHLKLSPDEERKRVQELLAIVGLHPEDINKYPHQFSGGQLQRVSIARAISLKPKLIVFDEAVSSLDVSVQAQILNLLIDLKEEFNLSYLFISHDIEAVYYISDCLAVMYLGNIIELINGITLNSELKHPYTKKLMSSVLHPHPRCRKRIDLNIDEISFSKGSVKGCNYAERCNQPEDICLEKVPKLRRFNKDHLVACFKI